MLADDFVVGEAALRVLRDHVHVVKEAVEQLAIEDDGRAAGGVEALDKPGGEPYGNLPPVLLTPGY